MISFNKEINRSEIIYSFDGITITCRKNPKWEISVSSIEGIDEKLLGEILNKVIGDLNNNEVICITLENNLEIADYYLVKLNSKYSNSLIYKVREDNIDNIRKYMNTIREYHLPIIINYVIPSYETDIESSLQTLKELNEFYSVDDITKSRFRSYGRNINKVYLTKQLECGVCDSSYEQATFMYFLDRFGFKTTFEGEHDLVESWKNNIREYYQNTYLLSKKRNLKVVQ